MPNQTNQYRILVIDDNPAIHEDFRKIFHAHGNSKMSTELQAAEAALFGEAHDSSADALEMNCQIDTALQGEDGWVRVRLARQQGKPYAVAFIDVRMPPGWDGIETTARIWKEDPDIQVVLCTAYSDYSWADIQAKLGRSDRLLILKKPFDTIEVMQLAHALTEKWHLLRELRRQIGERSR